MPFKFKRDIICCFEGYELTNMTAINPTRYIVVSWLWILWFHTDIRTISINFPLSLISQCSICGKSNKQYFTCSSWQTVRVFVTQLLICICDQMWAFFILEWQRTRGNLCFCSQHVSAWKRIITGEYNKLYASQTKFDYIFLQDLQSNLTQVPQVNLTNSCFTWNCSKNL